MSHIVLSPDQVRVLRHATTSVELRDETGQLLARIPAPTEAQILQRIESDKRAGVARFPAEQVEARLRKLEAIREREGMDKPKMRELLRQMRASEDG